MYLEELIRVDFLVDLVLIAHRPYFDAISFCGAVIRWIVVVSKMLLGSGSFKKLIKQV